MVGADVQRGPYKYVCGKKRRPVSPHTHINTKVSGIDMFLWRRKNESLDTRRSRGSSFAYHQENINNNNNSQGLVGGRSLMQQDDAQGQHRFG